jgi:putative MATE family efflux protein
VQSKYSLTEGSIWKGILLFAFPIFLGQVFQQLYNTFDAWCVGYFINDDAMGAVTSSGSLIFLMVSFFNGLAMGAGVVIARYYGAKNDEAVSKTIHTAVAFGLCTGTALTIVGTTCTPIIIRWMGIPDETMVYAVPYYRYYFCGAIFTVMYNIFVGIHHAVGDSKHPLYYLICSTMINVVLDLLFVGVMGYGVGAAALATTVSQGISAALCCIHLVRAQDSSRLYLRKIRFHLENLKEIIRYGLPSAVQNSVIALANVVVQSNIFAFGADAVNGCGAYSKLEGFAFLPVMCFSQSLSTFTGQNLGAKQHDRVKRGVGFGIACSLILAEIVGGLSYLFAPELIGIFAKSEAAIDYGTRHMRTICLFYCLLAFSHCIAGIMRGAGKATVPMFTMLVCWCLIRVSYITLAVQFAPVLTTVSWAYPITWTLSSIVFLVYFLKADWIHNFDRMEAKKAASRK